MREPSEFYYCLKEQLKKIRIQEENERILEELRKSVAAQKSYPRKRNENTTFLRGRLGAIMPRDKKAEM